MPVVHMWMSEGGLLELALFFRHVSPGDQTQVIKLGSGHIYPQSHLFGVSVLFLTENLCVYNCVYEHNVHIGARGVQRGHRIPWRTELQAAVSC